MTAATTNPETPGPASTVEEPRTDWVSAIPFFGVHLAPLAAFFVTVTWQDWVLCAVLYVTRMFCITAGYHRYFSHRSYKMGRVAQFLMAFGGTMAIQKGPLWWAGHHRIHHRYTDLDGDVHSPREGFWWSHVGWILSTKYKDTDLSNIKDFAAYPELRLLERFQWVPPWLLGIGCLLIGGWGALLIGFFLSTVLLWHGTFLVNSATHLFGRRRYATPDTSRNSMIIAVITGGEGWHNNHHYLPASSRQGFRWWEFDPTWYLLRGMAALHLVHGLKRPPVRLLDQAKVGDGAFDIGMFRSYWERAAKLTGDQLADMMASPLPSAGHPASTAPPDHQGTAEGAATGLAPEAEVSHLRRCISQALESADLLASATRRTRRNDLVVSEPQPAADDSRR